MGDATAGLASMAQGVCGIGTAPLSALANPCYGSCLGNSSGLLDFALAPFKAVFGFLGSAIGGIGTAAGQALGGVGKLVLSPVKILTGRREPTLLERIAAELVPLRSAIAAPGADPEQHRRELLAYETVKRGDPLDPSQLSGVRKEIGETLLAVSDAQAMVKDFQTKLHDVGRTIAALEAQKAKVEGRRAALATAGSKSGTSSALLAKGEGSSDGSGSLPVYGAVPGGAGPAMRDDSDVTGAKGAMAGVGSQVRGSSSPGIASSLSAAGKGTNGSRSGAAGSGDSWITGGAAGLKPTPESEADPEGASRAVIRGFLDESQARIAAATGGATGGAAEAATFVAGAEGSFGDAFHEGETIFQKVHQVYESRRRSGAFGR